MNPQNDSEPLALDELLTPDERRTVTVEDHRHFIKSLATDERGVDEIDRAVEDEDDFDPRLLDRPPGRRKESEIAGLFDILDSLPPARADMEKEARHG